MTQLRRTTTPNGMPLQQLELNHICDQCNQPRNRGNHQRCSKQRQASNQHRWASK